jgi:hypothetical protein
MGMAEVDGNLTLLVCKLRVEAFDKFSAQENAERLRRLANRGRADVELPAIDHIEWRLKMHQIIKQLERRNA